MENPDPNLSYDKQFVRNMIESALRIGLIALLLWMTFDIIRPFLVPLVWGAIIAIAAYPIVVHLAARLGGRTGPASAIVTFTFILLLVLPSYQLTDSLITAVRTLAGNVEAGTLEVPPPSPKVADWPLIGEPVYAQWSLASTNLEAVLGEFQPQLKALLGRVGSSLGRGLLGVGLFVVSLIIAGFFMAHAESATTATRRLFVRLAGEKTGGEWAGMVVSTVRSVLLGVVGVALIQSVLCAIGLFSLGVPGAPIWSAAILFLAIAQLPLILVVLPLVIWAYSSQDTTSATLFAIWMVLAALSDNLLKPLLIGRGLNVPMPVILIGAIGGMLALGIIGLFAGAVVLSVWYNLFREWLLQEAR